MASDFLPLYDEMLEASRAAEVSRAVPMMENPLYQRDQAILSGAQPVVTPPTEPVEVAADQPVMEVRPNPLVRPPLPMAALPYDKQVAVEKQQQEALARQDAHNRAMLEQTSGRRKEELDREGVRQATSLLGETGTLKPDDVANYPAQRAELVRKHPIGALTGHAKDILAQYDAIHQNAMQIQKEMFGRQDQAALQREGNRREGAVKLASDLGGDAIAKFYQVEKDQGTEAAIQATMGVAANTKKDNLVAMLENAGMTPDQIQREFTSPSGEFRFGAAEARAKVRVNPQQEVARIGNMLADMDQEKREAGPRKWTFEQEASLQGTRQLYNRSLERAGIKLPTDPNVTATATPTPTQGRATPTPTPAARPTATPSATPPPPPLNPKYPEQWKNGERYIQMEDGKWHKSKVQ